MNGGRHKTRGEPTRSRRIAALIGTGVFLLGTGAGVTKAAWVDEAPFGAAASASTFDIQGRFAESPEVVPQGNSIAVWEDVGLPGNPDTFPPGSEIVIPPIHDVLPGHSYAGDVFLCNAGNVDGVITDATLEEVTVNSAGGPSNSLVVVGSIEVDEISIGTVIPANSCQPSLVEDPPNDIEGVIHFTTVGDFTGMYGATSSIVIRIEVTSCPALPAPCTNPTTGWIDLGGSKMEITAIEQAPPTSTATPVVADPTVNGTAMTGLAWSGQNGPNPTPTTVCFDVSITTTSPTPVPWRLVIHTDESPFGNVAPFQGFQFGIFGMNQAYNFTPAPDYATSGDYYMTPTQPVQNASLLVPHLARVCANVPEPAWRPAGPTTYTQLSPLQLVMNGTMPCVAGTVQGNSPFYVGFTLLFNWKTFLDAQRAANAITQAEYNLWITFTHWAGGPPGFLPSQGATGTDFQVSLQGYSPESRNVADFANVTIASCAY